MNETGMTEREFAERIVELGGRLYRVGGCVRDAVMGVPAKDVDYCVTGMVKRNFREQFPTAKECGKAFSVFLLTLNGVKSEVAFARTERKVGPGYQGFKISTKPKITIEEDLLRRDTTINSMAIDCLSGKLIDPYGGRADIERKLLRATSEHFSEDPIRALRLAGQAARFDFAIEPATLALAATVAAELKDEAPERMLAELTKALSEASAPARFFRVLRDAKLLDCTFGELAQLPDDKLETALRYLDAAAATTADSKLRFAAMGLAADKTTLENWSRRMTLPNDWLNAALTAGELATLLATPAAENKVTAVLRLRRGALSVAEFDALVAAAGLSLPALQPLLPLLKEAGKQRPPEGVTGPQIGQWLKEKQIEAVAAAQQ